MLTDMVTTLLLFRGFRVTRDPVETGYVRVLQGLRSNSLIPYGIRLQSYIFGSGMFMRSFALLLISIRSKFNFWFWWRIFMAERAKISSFTSNWASTKIHMLLHAGIRKECWKRNSKQNSQNRAAHLLPMRSAIILRCCSSTTEICDTWW